jgi:ankyrin repeat protein
MNVQCKYDNQTVLHRAALGGSKAVVKLLLEKSDPNVLDRDKKTALHIAAEKGYTLVVELLLEKPNPTLKSLWADSTAFGGLERARGDCEAAA